MIDPPPMFDPLRFLRSSRILFPTVVLALLAAVNACALPGQPAPAQPQDVTLTGFLEASAVDIEPEIGGRLVSVDVGEGDQVQEGETLARLDDSLLQLQLSMGDAEIAEAEARLAQLQAVVRPEDIALAEARVAYARAGLAAAESALTDARRLRDNPQDLKVQIAQANAALKEAEAQAKAAQLNAAAADINARMWEAITRDLWDGASVHLPSGGSIRVDAPADKVDYANRQWNLAGQQAWAAWQDASAADAAVEQARMELADLKREREQNQAAEAQVTAAANARDEAEAAVQQAEAALALTKKGATAAQINAARAAVEQARAARNALAAQQAQTVIHSPIDGVVTARYLNSGEVVGPGQRLLTISRPGQLELTVYVPARLLAEIQPGMILPVRVDSAPGRRFQATVLTINDEAEFTLRQAQNVAERAENVYAVRLRLDSSDPLLRPGLPADVLLSP